MVKMPSLQKNITKLKGSIYVNKTDVLEEVGVVAQKIRESFESFDVVDFLQGHNVKYDEWLKSQFFHLIKDLEKEVLGLLVEQEGEKDDGVSKRLLRISKREK